MWQEGAQEQSVAQALQITCNSVQVCEALSDETETHHIQRRYAM